MIKKHNKLSWRKDKYDKRDFIHKVDVGAGIPITYSLASCCPDVRDQGNLGSCTGFGIGGILTGLSKQQNIYTQWFSPEWIYNGARYIEGTLNEDAGAEPGDCLAWIKQMGCLLESYWPYNLYILDTRTPPTADDAPASKYPILTYTRVTGGSTGICSALAAGNFVTIGTPWFDSWMNPPITGVLPIVSTTSSLAGGHQTFLYGYDQASKLFFGQNSWGTSWGKSGTFLMPFAVFDSVFNALGGYDAYYISVSWSATPTPEQILPIIRLQESKDNGVTWSDLYKSSIKIYSVIPQLKLEKSNNGGVIWSQMYKGSIK